MEKRFVVPGAVLLILIMAGISGEESLQGEQASAGAQMIKSSGASFSPSIKIDTDFGRLPLYFIPNKGQMDEQVAYYVQGKDTTFYFTDKGITLALTRALERGHGSRFSGSGGSLHDTQEGKSGLPKAGPRPSQEGGVERWVVKLDFIGANRNIQPVGETETGAVVSYFKGKPEEWRTGLRTYSRIAYRNLWPGIDLVYYGTVNRLKYEFIVHPGADPSKIRLAYRGAENVSVDGEGRLQVTTPAGGFSDDVPVAFQEVRGERVGVPLAYRLVAAGEIGEGNNRPERTVADSAEENQGQGAHAYGFEVGTYNPTETLVLDPAILAYCGYVGGSSNEYGNGIAVDSSGNAYITGYTSSMEASFPVTAGPDLTANGTVDAFVVKVNSAGGSLVYCGYIGGSSGDYAYGIAVDGSGSAYVTGYTYSDQTTFPEISGPDLTHNGGADGFVAKVNPSGDGLVYCGYIGGSGTDGSYAIAVDGSGNAYVTGDTDSNQTTFPEISGPDLTYNGNIDAFIAMVSATGGSLSYCGYIGGASTDSGNGIAVDGSGSAYVTGYTYSTEATFPVAVGPDLVYNGDYDVFVAKVYLGGTSLAYCGYIGGSASEFGNGIAVDGPGNAYVAGHTLSTAATFPVVVGPDLVNTGGYDAFVAKVYPTGTTLAYCGYIGGSSSDYGNGIAVDGSGNAYVTGQTYSSAGTFPVAEGPDLSFNGNDDAFVAKVHNTGGSLIYCGYLGGSSNDYGSAIAVDRSRNAYVTGYSGSTELTFPETVGPDLTYNGGGDVFVSKVYYFEQPVQKHALGDFDGDGSDEFALDFGSTGAWMWNGGAWSQLTASNPENMVPFDVDGNGDKEIAVDLGSLGLWMWNGGVWSQLSANNPEYLIAADTNDNGIDELIIDFGATGLKWRQESGFMYGMTAVDPQNIIALDVDNNGTSEVVADFGPVGMWLWEAAGSTWQMMTAADPNTLASVDAFGFGNQGVAAGLGGLGVWLWDSGVWGQLSGVVADRLISGKMVLGGGEETAGDFGLTGMWLWGSSVWTQLSNVNADDLIAADADGNGIDEVVGDFAQTGLWLWSSGAWSQLSGVNPEGMLAGNIDGNSTKELIVDFGTLGVWLWNGGTWSQVSALNPD